MPGLVVEMGVDGDEIRGGVDVVEGRELRAAGKGDLLADIGIVAEDLHLKGRRAGRHFAPHLAQADHGEGLARELDADELAPFPQPLFKRGRRLWDMPRQGGYERESVLGGR